MSNSNNDQDSYYNYEHDLEQREEALLCVVRLQGILAKIREQRDLRKALDRSLLDQSNVASGITTGDNSFNNEHGGDIPQTTSSTHNEQQVKVSSTTTDNTVNQDDVIVENTQDELDDNYHADYTSFINITLDSALNTKLKIIDQDEFTGIFEQQFYDSIRRPKTKQRPGIPVAFRENIQTQPQINEPGPLRPNITENTGTASAPEPENLVITCVSCEGSAEFNPDIGFAYCSPCGYAFCTNCGNAFHGGLDCHGPAVPLLNTDLIVREMEARVENVRSQRMVIEKREVRERERLVSEPQDRDVRERERVERELIDNERAIREQERRERDRLERERQEREVMERERVERDRVEKDRIDRERAIREEERRERDRLERERQEREVMERERVERDRVEKDRIDRERAIREEEIRERDRLERDRLERERQIIENERLERLRREREARELESKQRREQKKKDDKASEELIRNSCKRCPGCKNYIEQDTRGCNHMTCSRCKMEFCWVCMYKIKSQSDLERHYTRCTLFKYQVD